MPTLLDRCEQYNNGLITAHEFLGFVIEIISGMWEAGKNETAFAEWLVNQLQKP